jgi:hypothetical protein
VRTRDSQRADRTHSGNAATRPLAGRGHEVSISNDSREQRAALLIAGTFLFIALKPFYFWDSGLPQVSDLVLSATILHTFVVALRRGWSLLGRASITRMAMLFAYYATAVNLIAMLLTNGDASFLYSSAYLTYNAAALVWILLMLRHHAKSVAYAMVAGILVGLSIQVLMILAAGGFGGARATGSFNNPNQLGYYALLCAALLLAAPRVARISNVAIGAGLALSMLTAVASLSKAAILAACILLLGLAIVGPTGSGRPRTRLRTTTLLLGVCAIAAGPRVEWVQSHPLVQNVTDRFTASESDGSLEARGYSRIFQNPEHWLFGAGEGGFDRFGANIEIHSTLGNLLMSYGAIGVLLFMAILACAAKKSGLAGVYITASILAYGMTHNGIRNTFLWILLGFLASSWVSSTTDKPLRTYDRDRGVPREELRPSHGAQPHHAGGTR